MPRRPTSPRPKRKPRARKGDPVKALFNSIAAMIERVMAPVRPAFPLFRYQCRRCRVIVTAGMQLNASGMFCPAGCGQTMGVFGETEAPKPKQVKPERMSREHAARFLFEHGNPAGAHREPAWVDFEYLLVDRYRRAAYYKRAAARLHPDAGGSHEDFVKLQEAMEALKES